ncbi:hypothetical protein GGF46_002144 [Coemansia sp. RSA 552]|nr:hypothetical protein GGF46_002144 [Coemansia sp. RSA 552]
MVRRHVAANEDASPFLGLSEETAVPMHLHIRVAASGTQTPAIQAHTSVQSTGSVFSPLVVGWKRASNGQFGVSVGRETETVEELAATIEEAWQRRCGEGLAAAALFRGRTPLMFGQRVRDVLVPGDVVTVYVGEGGSPAGSDDDNDDDDDDDEGSMDDDPVLIDFGPAKHGECALVPLRNADEATATVSTAPCPSVDVAEVAGRASLKTRFVNVLVEPRLVRPFMGFCALPSELALESLLFVLDVERFRHVQPSMARLLANYIYLSYVAPHAPLLVNVSAQMRERIPWPFLPGWEYNPWVFDEALAGVGFALKKHTLLRFERSPVGLASVLSEELADRYVAPLSMDQDPMLAIAEHFEPDIDVVIWVNELQQTDGDPAQVVAGLAQLTLPFREQLLERVCAQFVDPHHAYSLCSGYFELASQLAPLQKQRKLKKSRKLRNFFGLDPNESLLRQQLLAVVPPSAQSRAARAAAELVARKRTAEARMRAHDEILCSQHMRRSLSSSMLAEQKMLADSDSDVVGGPAAGWAHEAMLSAASPRDRSWSSSTNSSDGDNGRVVKRNANGWTTEEDSAAGEDDGGDSYNQTLNRALSMIGVAHDYSPGSDGGSPRSMNTQQLDEHSQYSVYTARSSSSSLARTRLRFTRFERKRRADKLRDFFGRADAAAADQHVPSDDHDDLPSIGSASFVRDHPLTASQRNLLVRRRRKLKAILGEQVDESVVSIPRTPGSQQLSLLGASDYSLPTPDRSLSSTSGDLAGSRDIQIRQYSKIREVLGASAPAPLYVSGPSEAPEQHPEMSAEEQRDRARWRRNKLKSILGDVPPDVSTLYRTETRSSEATEDQGPHQQLKRRRQQKLRKFFGQSLNPDAMLMQGIGGGGDIPDDESFEMVATSYSPSSSSISPISLEAAQAATGMLPDLDTVGRAQFWVTSSPESQESALPNDRSHRRTSLMATLRAHKASIIGSIKREPRRARSSTMSTHASDKESVHPAMAAVPSPSPVIPPQPLSASPGKRSFLARKIRPETMVGGGGGASPASVQQRNLPLVPPRSTSIKPLSPLPAISPNNLQASFDRSMALRDVPETGRDSSANKPPPIEKRHIKKPGMPSYPPRIRSAERSQVPPDGYDHRHMITSVLMSAPDFSTRTNKRAVEAGRQRSGSRAAGKSVHWFDSPRTEQAHVWEEAIRVSEAEGSPRMPPVQTPSAKSSMELGMAIVLRSPSTKKPAIKSPVMAPRVDPRGGPAGAIPAAQPPLSRTRFPSLPIGSPTSGPRMVLSHKASISAVGGRHISGKQLEPKQRPRLLSATLMPATEPPSSGTVKPEGTSQVVTLRPRRSQSFLIHRKLDRATVGRRRANTIGSGRQTTAPKPRSTTEEGASGIPQADKNSRRVQSMNLAQDISPEAKMSRNRCVTVIPLRLELQRLLARRRALARDRRAARQFELETIKELDEQMDSAGNNNARLRSLQKTAEALCAHSSRAARMQRSSASSLASSLGSFNVHVPGRRHSHQPPAVSSTIRFGRLYRSRSCSGRFVTPRRRAPISPAVARYLQSANQGYQKRMANSYSGASSYQRISMALLARPPHTTGRRSLDNRPFHRKLSPFMESSLSRFASMGSSPGGSESDHIIKNKEAP